MVSAQDGCSQPIKDLWQSNATHPQGAPAFHLMGTQYEEYLFRDEALRVLENHPASTPLLLFYAAHVGHFPLQVPKAAFDKTVLTEGVGDVQSCGGSTGPVWPGWSNISDGYSCRRQYHAMVNLLDEVISDLTSTMVSKAMWERTLMIFSSDNGGQAKWQNAAGANMPLVSNSSGRGCVAFACSKVGSNHLSRHACVCMQRGGKYSPWEGGIRVAAFVAGGIIPAGIRGTKQLGIIHGCDWLVTLAFLAGEDPTDHDAAASGLPPVDGMNVWPLISGANATSPWASRPLPISTNALILGDWKLLTGVVGESGWTGWIYPNASTAAGARIDGKHNCSTGCLFNVATDHGEHIDLAGQQPQRVASMNQILQHEVTSFFKNTDHGHNSPLCPTLADPTSDASAGEDDCGCWMAIHYYHGAFGPFQEIL